MAAHNHIRLKNACFHHDGFGFRRHHLFARTAVHGDRSGSVRAREELRDGYGGSHPHGTLRAVLVAVKCALGTPQGVVFQNDAEVRAGSASLVFSDEGGRESGHGHGQFKIMRFEIRREFSDRLGLLKADLGMLGNPVAHGQKLGVHQLLHAREDLLPPLVRRGELCHHRRNAERLAQASDLLDHIAGCFAFRWGFLRNARPGQNQGNQYTGRLLLHETTSAWQAMRDATYFMASAPALAHWPSCALEPPETPMAPTIFPSMTSGMPPSTGTAP